MTACSAATCGAVTCSHLRQRTVVVTCCHLLQHAVAVTSVTCSSSLLRGHLLWSLAVRSLALAAVTCGHLLQRAVAVTCCSHLRPLALAVGSRAVTCSSGQWRLLAGFTCSAFAVGSRAVTCSSAQRRSLAAGCSTDVGEQAVATFLIFRFFYLHITCESCLQFCNLASSAH